MLDSPTMKGTIKSISAGLSMRCLISDPGVSKGMSEEVAGMI